MLRNHYPSMPRLKLCQKLQRGWEGIKTAAKIHGISRPRKRARTLFFADGKPKFRVLKNGCWKWIAATNKKGYPITRGGKDTTLAHRQVYIDKHGPIPDGFDVDHLCRLRRCVNVAHLEAVTHLINIRRGGGRTRLTPSLVAEIRTKLAAYLDDELGLMYGVRGGTIWHIRNGRTWR